MAGVRFVSPCWSDAGTPHAVAHVGIPSIKLALLVRKSGAGDSLETVARHRAGWEKDGWKMADIRGSTLMKAPMRELVAMLKEAVKAARNR